MFPAGDILPGAVELPTVGSNWRLQDIGVLQGKEPEASESEIDESPAEEEEEGSETQDQPEVEEGTERGMQGSSQVPPRLKVTVHIESTVPARSRVVEGGMRRER